MHDTPIRFIVHKSTNTLHDRLCVNVNDIPEGDSITLDKLDKSMTICERCKRKIFIRNAIKDDENFLWYLEFLDKGKLGTNEIKGFIYMRGVELLKLSEMELQVNYNDDTWIIVCVRNNRYNLLHNDYIATSVTERHILPGKFHSQKEVPLRMKDLFKYIAMYDWRAHFRQDD